jgi:hypothetical protein
VTASENIRKKLGALPHKPGITRAALSTRGAQKQIQ